MNPINDPIFSKFDQMAGTKTPVTGSSAPQSRADEIRALAKSPQSSGESTDNRNILQKAAGFVLDPLAKLATETGNLAGKGIVKGVEMFQSPEQKAQTEARLQEALNKSSRVPGLGTEVKGLNKVTSKDVAGQVLGVAGLATGNPMLGGAALGAGGALENQEGALGVTLNAIGGALGGKILDIGFKAAAPHIEKALQKYGMPLFEKLESKIPKGVKDTYRAMAEKVKLPEVPGVNKLQTAASNIDKNISEKVSGLAGDTKTKAGNLIKGKTEAQILTVPKESVYKLNPSERKIWFDNEQAKISSHSEATNKQIIDNLNKQAEITTKASEDLQKKLSIASRDKVIELRPKIVKAMGEQSKIYRSLVDEGMAGKENVPINTADLAAHIESRYGDNPGMLNAIKEKLGITDQSEMKTLGELYNQTKSLRQDISSAATKGTKTFSSSDKLTDDAVHTLTDFMKENGVDFSEANKFWSRYAPIRNQLVTEAKPFLQTGTATKTFANTLERVAKGTDVNNENFINQVEHLIGESITKENKAIIEKLTENQKVAIANELAAKEKQLATQMAKEKSLAKLSSDEIEATRQARLREHMKTVLKMVATGALGATVVKAVGF